MIGFRAGTTNVKTSPINDLSITSEANQFKLHKVGTIKASAVNQVFTIEHGLGYTPAFLIFFRQTNFNAYYELEVLGGSNYANKNTLSIQLANAGDMATYLIFKDFGY